MKQEVLILSTPRIAPVRPPSAPFILKAVCSSAGKTSKVLDINLDFFTNFFKEYPAEAKEIDDYFITFTKTLTADTQTVYNKWIDNWVDTIIENNPLLLAVCVFSWQSQRFVTDLLTRVRPKFKGEIIIGGQGLINSQNMSSHWATAATYAEDLLSLNLIDWYLKGETEETFFQFLDGNRELPGLNNGQSPVLHDMNTVPYGDFSDVDISAYQNGHESGVLPVESCRGCVRNCIFCEMSSDHGSFRRRSGDVLANEIIHQYETYGVKHYYFHDDLINGDLVEFDKFLNCILTYYNDHKLEDRYFTFSGYWIIRAQKQFGEKDFEKFYRAGGNTLVTGVETGSDRLRKKMKKGFINKDLEFNLECMAKFKMKFYFMLIAGLPGETIDDFNDTMGVLSRWQKFVATGTIIGINLGTTATIEPGTEIYNNYQKYNIIGLKNERPHSINWMSTETPDLTYKERVRRRVLLQEHVIKLGFPLWKGDDHLKIIIDKYKEHIEMWNE